jgi:hypothetical protein
VLRHNGQISEKERYDEQFKVVFDAIRALMAQPEKLKKPIGFEVKEGTVSYGMGARKAI